MRFFSVTKQSSPLYFFLLRRCRNGNRFWLFLWRKWAMALHVRKHKKRGNLLK